MATETDDSNNARVPKSTWSWPGTPANQAEFEAMMASLDAHLAGEGRAPAQRPFPAALLLSQNLGHSGKPLLPIDRIPINAPYDSGWCIRAAWLWWEKVYGDQVKIDFGPGSVAFRIRGTIWRMQMPRVHGTVEFFADRNLQNQGRSLAKMGDPPASGNMLCFVEGLTQDLAARLDDAEIALIVEAFNRGYRALLRLESLTGDDFFGQAMNEYRSSIDALLASSWPQARRNTASCAEMMFKGMLRKAGTAFPTGGRDGHDIPKLGGQIGAMTWVTFNAAVLAAVHCSTDIRYIKEPATADNALLAHRSLLEILNTLRK